MSIMNFRPNHFSNDIVIIDGLWRSGKSLICPILSCGEKIEKWQCNYNFEYVCALSYLNKIDFQSTVEYLKLLTDVSIYDTCISREVNFRPKDESSVFRNANIMLYLRRLFQNDDHGVVRFIERKRPKLLLSTHMVFPVLKLLYETFSNRLKLILVEKNPVYLIDFWASYLQRLGTDKKEFTLSIGKNGDVPWFINDVQHYEELNFYDRAIYCISILTQIQDELFHQHTINDKSCIVIPFEGLILDSKNYVNEVCEFLKIDFNRKMNRCLSQYNCPRPHINSSTSRQFRFRSGKIISEKDHFNSLYEQICDKASDGYISVLNSLINRYRKRYSFKREMPWDKSEFIKHTDVGYILE